MDAFLTRLISEQEELSIKISNLESFFEKQDFINLTAGNQILLKEQALAMNKYNDILTIRIELNKS